MLPRERTASFVGFMSLIDVGETFVGRTNGMLTESHEVMYGPQTQSLLNRGKRRAIGTVVISCSCSHDVTCVDSKK